ncbi:unnamed protein product [Lepeophtheirus salmonis]|uniref:(salmon louse) hypothetical protein n=1 Tax=Lepeophtheirus salmonis TaxID=72036 RepID=A0A7R8CF09_LEPSM|nr:unnamed protein product [Lepeophtheirus salmonis]CAF2802052.1 unnamed protein product [Lepeophtheirus salmonis]
MSSILNSLLLNNYLAEKYRVSCPLEFRWCITMPKICCVPGCRTGYKNEGKDPGVILDHACNGSYLEKAIDIFYIAQKFFSEMRLIDICEHFVQKFEDDLFTTADTYVLLENLSINDIPAHTDSGILFYISGYCCNIYFVHS